MGQPARRNRVVGSGAAAANALGPTTQVPVRQVNFSLFEGRRGGQGRPPGDSREIRHG